MTTTYLGSIIQQFQQYKTLGEKAILQVPEDKLFWMYNSASNSVAIIVKHLWGNMRSRWTDFLRTDGEKEWRNRDAEFENEIESAEELWQKWNEGWQVVFEALAPLRDEDLDKTVYIRAQGHTVTEAIHRQLTHYAYHVGQLVFLAKMITANDWQSLSIPKGKSQEYNQVTFNTPKQAEQHTDSYLSNPNLTDFLAYFTKIRERTKKVVSLIPEQYIEWTYQAGKFTLGDIVRHIAGIERFMYAETVCNRPSLYQGCGKELAPGYAQTMRYFEEKHQEAMQIFNSLTDRDLLKKCKTPAGIEIRIGKWLRAMIEHEIHHRSQIYLYLAMLNIKTPPIFGMTAEELALVGKQNTLKS